MTSAGTSRAVTRARAVWERVRENPMPVVAWTATFLITFFTTLGPVYSFRLGMGPLEPDLSNDTGIQMFFAAFYVAVLVGLGRFGPYPRLPRSLAISLGAFCTVIVASTFWSYSEPLTLVQSISLCLTAAAGLAVGRATTVPQQITAVFASQTLGALLSIIAVLRNATRAYDFGGRWSGVYFTRNSLGPVGALGLIGIAGCACLLWDRRRAWPTKWFTASIIGLLVAAGMCLAVMVGAQALTPVLGLIAAALGVSGIVVLRRVSSGSPGAVTRNAVIVIIGLVIAGAIVWFGRATVLPWVGRDATFNHRTELWDYLIKVIGRRPSRGWGWLAVWKAVNPTKALHYEEAHNGFIEVLLGTGFLGFTLIVAFTVTLLWRTARNAAAHGGMWLWPFALVVYSLTIAQLESYIGGNLLPWVLLTMAAATTVGGRGYGVRKTGLDARSDQLGRDGADGSAAAGGDPNASSFRRFQAGRRS